jgi:hypothetical protein
MHPTPLLHVCTRWLTQNNPRGPTKERKKERCQWNTKAMGELTETPGHAWLRVPPNT